ncbi:MAG: Hsp20/alpha crystallin family protein [Deltaproteobacteria bacterium]|nr:Hsp20/alpha crystallin family protein [Deltaproteobacteria bacterium]MBW2069674.1 Hsp20/alpha crystallin family protein [Deltaproteobacteria bacterium]
MAVVRWRPGLFGWQKDPFAEMERLQREISRLFESFSGTQRVSTAGVFPAINVSEDSENLYVRAELPGVSPEDIEITTQDNNLIIKGERKIAAEGEDVCYHRREREAGRFQRITSLPSKIDSSRVTAVCKNGVLTVTLPKAIEAKPRQIEVKSS